MADRSSIEWCDATWNPVTGCDRISPGCAHCYAKELHDRRHKAVLAGKSLPVQYAHPFETVQLHRDRLDQPLRWRKPRRVFVNSLSDLFHDDVPREFITRVFAVMCGAPQHTFQVLTKRPARMLSILSDPAFPADVEEANEQIAGSHGWCHAHGDRPYPFSNVWLGVSVENQRFADERIPLLLQTPAAVRFISAEPLLGPITIRKHLMAGKDPGRCANCGKGHGFTRCPNYGGIAPTNDETHCTDFRRANFALDWVIVGGESGPGSRAFDIAWARSIVAQCQAADVPVFVKQLGTNPAPLRVEAGSVLERLWLRDPKGGDPAEWPVDLRVREYPSVAMQNALGEA